MSDENQRRMDRFDRFAGRLVFRVVGVFAAIMAVFATVFGLAALRGGEWMGAVILGIALALGWGVRYCFSDERRLSDGDWS